jgi:hypothetical protein
MCISAKVSTFQRNSRKETYPTSGLRMKVRLFGGWDYNPAILQQQDWVNTGYAKGVPMGGDLPEKKSPAPSFIVWAERDPKHAAAEFELKRLPK